MTLNVFTAFSGYDSQCMALDRMKINYELVGWPEIDKYAIMAHNAIYPQYKDRNFGDISKIDWDNDIPNDIYFDELFRISNKCIIWGGNYYKLPPCQCFIFWYKQNSVPNFSDGEFAWTNFNCPAKCFDYRYYGNLQGKSSVKEKKIHPTQKPIILYEWLLQNFAEPGQRILDTHGGSVSHAIAAHKLGFDLTIIEKDPVYYEQAKKRLIEFQRQQVLF